MYQRRPPNLVASTADLSERDIKENPVVKEEETNDTEEVFEEVVVEVARLPVTEGTQIIGIAAAWVINAATWIVHGTTGTCMRTEHTALGISASLIYIYL